MDYSPTKYRHVPCGGRSAGTVEFNFPLVKLLDNFVVRFAVESLQRLQRGQKISDLEEFVDGFSLGPEVLWASGFADGVAPLPNTWDGSWLSLQELTAKANDLVNDAGVWREQSRSLTETAHEYAADFAMHLTSAVFKAKSQFGQRAASRFLTTLRTQCTTNVTQLQRKVGANNAPLVRATRNSTNNVQRMTARKTWRTWFAERYGQVRWRGAWTPYQQKKIRDFVDALNRLDKARFETLERRARLDLLSQLLKHIKREQSLLDAGRKRFAALLNAVAACEQGKAPLTATQVPVLRTLDCEIDTESGQTVQEEFLARARRADRSPVLLAKELREEGLQIRQERFLPHQWSDFEPADLVSRILRRTRRYLGCHDSDRELDPGDPRTATDHCAQLGLCHPLIKPHLTRALVNELYRSAPYAEFDRLQGVPENIQTFLFCYPGDREELIALFSRQSKIAERNNASEYAIAHPFSMTLVRCRIAAPIGAMPAMRRWALLACDSKRNQRVAPIESEDRMNEVLLLPERVRCNIDSGELLDAAIKSGIVARVGATGCFALTRDDPRFTALFSPPQWKINRVSAPQVHALLKDGEELSMLLVRQFPAKSGLRALLTRLTKEIDADHVVEELVREGVLLKHGVRYALHPKLPIKPHRVPRELVRSERGPLVGINRDEFIARLATDDLLYTVLFFGVMRAWRLEDLSENDVPDSVITEAVRILG